jgi:serine/threonine protein kinase
VIHRDIKPENILLARRRRRQSVLQNMLQNVQQSAQRGPPPPVGGAEQLCQAAGDADAPHRASAPAVGPEEERAPQQDGCGRRQAEGRAGDDEDLIVKLAGAPPAVCKNDGTRRRASHHADSEPIRTQHQLKRLPPAAA